MSQKDWQLQLKLFGIVLSSIMGHVGAGVFLGYLLIEKSTWFVAAGALLGLLFAMMQIHRFYKKSNNNK